MGDIRPPSEVTSLMASLQTDSSKTRVPSLKALTQYLMEATLSVTKASSIPVTGITTCLIHCMSREFTKLSQLGHSSGRFGGRGRSSVSMGLVNQFEIIVKILSSRCYSTQPRCAIPLVDHIITYLKQCYGTHTHLETSWEGPYASSLASLLGCQAVVAVLPGILIVNIARILLQPNGIAELKTASNNFPFIKRIQFAFRLLSNLPIDQKQKLLYAICTRVASYVLGCGERNHTAFNGHHFSILCKLLFHATQAHPLSVLSAFYYCPKLWLTLHSFIQNWNQLYNEAQIQLCGLVFFLCFCLKLPTRMGNFFYNTTAGSLFQRGPLKLLCDPLKTLLQRKLSSMLCEQPNNHIDAWYTSFCTIISSHTSAADTTLQLSLSRTQLICDEIKSLWGILHILSEFILEFDVIAPIIPLLLEAEISSASITKQLFQVIHLLHKDTDHHDLVPLLVSGALLRKMVNRNVLLSVEGQCQGFILHSVRLWKSSFLRELNGGISGCECSEVTERIGHSQQNVDDISKTQNHHIIETQYWSAIPLHEFFSWIRTLPIAIHQDNYRDASLPRSFWGTLTIDYSQEILDVLLPALLFTKTKSNDQLSKIYGGDQLRASSSKAIIFLDLLYDVLTFVSSDYLRQNLEKNGIKMPNITDGESHDAGDQWMRDTRALAEPPIHWDEFNQHVWVYIIDRLSPQNKIFCDHLKQKLCYTALCSVVTGSIQYTENLLFFFNLLYHDASSHTDHTDRLHMDSCRSSSAYVKWSISAAAALPSVSLDFVHRINSRKRCSIFPLIPRVTPYYLHSLIKQWVKKLLTSLFSVQRTTGFTLQCHKQEKRVIRKYTLLLQAYSISLISISFSDLENFVSICYSEFPEIHHAIKDQGFVAVHLRHITVLLFRSNCFKLYTESKDTNPTSTLYRQAHEEGCAAATRLEIEMDVKSTFNVSQADLQPLFWELILLLQYCVRLDRQRSNTLPKKTVLRNEDFNLLILHLCLGTFFSMLSITEVSSWTIHNDMIPAQPEEDSLTTSDNVFVCSDGYESIEKCNTKDQDISVLKKSVVQQPFPPKQHRLSLLCCTILRFWVLYDKSLDWVFSTLLEGIGHMFTTLAIQKDKASIGSSALDQKTYERLWLVSSEKLNIIVNSFLDGLFIMHVHKRGVNEKTKSFSGFLSDFTSLLCIACAEHASSCNPSVINTIQMVFFRFVQRLCAAPFKLSNIDRIDFCRTLFFNEESEPIPLVRVAQCGRRYLLPYFVGGFWLLIGEFTPTMESDSKLSDILKTQLHTELTSGLELYIEHMVSLTTLSSHQFSFLNFVLVLGHCGFQSVFYHLCKDTLERLLLSFFAVLQMDLTTRLSPPPSPVLQHLFAPAFTSTCPESDAIMWEAMWRHLWILPFLPFTALFFYIGTTTTSKPFTTLLNIVHCDVASLMENQFPQGTLNSRILQCCIDYYKVVSLCIKTLMDPLQKCKISDCDKLRGYRSSMFKSDPLYIWPIRVLLRLYEEIPKTSMSYRNASLGSVLNAFVSFTKKPMGSPSWVVRLFLPVSSAVVSHVHVWSAIDVLESDYTSFDDAVQFFDTLPLCGSRSKSLLGLFFGLLLKHLKHPDDCLNLVDRFMHHTYDENKYNILPAAVVCFVKLHCWKLCDMDFLCSLTTLVDVIRRSPLNHMNLAHPYFIFWTFRQILCFTPSVIHSYLSWALQQVPTLKMNSTFLFYFQFIFGIILHHTTTTPTKKFRVLLYELVATIENLPDIAVTQLLYRRERVDHSDLMLLLPSSPYWTLSSALVSQLTTKHDHKPLMYESPSYQRDVWLSLLQQNSESIAEKHQCISSPVHYEDHESFKEIVDPFFLVLESLISRQFKQSLKSSSCTHHVSPASTSHNSVFKRLGYEFVFFFPPLQDLCPCQLRKIIRHVFCIVQRHVQCDDGDGNESTSLCWLNFKDVRHMLTVLSNSHERHTFCSVFQRRYILNVFSWLLFFYDKNAQEDPLLQRIMETSSSLTHVAEHISSCSLCEQENARQSCASNIDVSLLHKNNSLADHTTENKCSRCHFPLHRKAICYNIARQGISQTAHYYMKARMKVGSTSWISAIQRNVCLPLLFQFLSLSIDEPLTLVLQRCLKCIQQCCSVLALEPVENVHLVIPYSEQLRFSQLPLHSVPQLPPPWPSWMWSMDSNMLMNHRQSVKVNGSFPFSDELHDEPHRDSTTSADMCSENAKDKHPLASFNASHHLCNIFIGKILNEYDNEIDITWCPFEKYTNVCILQLPLLLCLYALGCNSFEGQKRETKQSNGQHHKIPQAHSTNQCSGIAPGSALVINELCNRCLSSHLDSKLLSAMRLIVHSIMLLREVFSIMSGFHFGITEKKHPNHATYVLITKSMTFCDLSKKRISECQNILSVFLKHLNKSDLAFLCLYHLGLPAEAHLFLHLNSSFPFSVPNPDNLIGHVPSRDTCVKTSVDKLALLESLGRLEVCREDAFHGNFFNHVVPEIMLLTAEARHQHWHRLTLNMSGSSDFRGCGVPSTFSWWQASGLLTTFPWKKNQDSLSMTSRHELRMEWLWRMGKWDAVEVLPQASTASFHTGLLYTFHDITKFIYRCQRTPDSSICLMDSAYHNRTTQQCQIRNDINNSINCIPLYEQSVDMTHTAMDALEHELLRYHIQDTLQEFVTGFLDGHLPDVLEKWSEVLKYFNGLPCLFWTYEPLLAAQRQLIGLLNACYSSRELRAPSDEVQASSLIYDSHYYAALRLQGLQDTAVALSLHHPLYQTAPHVEGFKGQLAEWLVIENFHALGDPQRTLLLALPLAQRIQEASDQQLTCDEARLSVSVMSTLGVWMFDAQWDDFDWIERTFFRFALSLTERYPNATQIQAHLQYASVLDTIIQNYEKNQFSEVAAFQTTELESHKDTLDSTLKEIARIQRLKKTPNKALLLEKCRLETLITNKEKTLEQQDIHISDLAARALHHYFVWNSHAKSSSHDVFKATSRCLSLWFKYSGVSISLNKTVYEFTCASDTASTILSHFRPFVYQIASRIQHLPSLKDVNEQQIQFQRTLTTVLQQLILHYPFHTLFPLVLLKNGDKIPSDYKSQFCLTSAKPQIQAVHELLLSTVAVDTQGFLSFILEAHVQFAEFFVHLGHLKPTDVCEKLHSLPKYKAMVASSSCLPIPTALPSFHVVSFMNQLPSQCSTPSKKKRRIAESLDSLKQHIRTFLHFPLVSKFDPTIDVIKTGLSQPKIISVWDSDGYLHRIIVKGRDDLRTDAVTEQLFYILNCILASVPDTRERNLALRTYQVVPLSPVVGLVQCVTGTLTLGSFLVGPVSKPFCGMHERYYPSDLNSIDARARLDTARTSSTSSLFNVYQEICDRIHPVLHRAFLDVFPTPSIWYRSLQKYTRSVALGSMVGYLIGLGDRHTNNILLDLRTGELIHIDFGVLFGRGETLSIPELVPFRLTRDLLSGLGPVGLEGMFRASCEVTLTVLRQMHNVIISILEVFLFDPLYIWAVKTAGQTSSNMSKQDRNPQARAALLCVQRKNMGGFHPLTLSNIQAHELNPIPVPSLVDRLFRHATSPQRLCQMYSGWCAWL